MPDAIINQEQEWITRAEAGRTHHRARDAREEEASDQEVVSEGKNKRGQVSACPSDKKTAQQSRPQASSRDAKLRCTLCSSDKEVARAVLVCIELQFVAHLETTASRAWTVFDDVRGSWMP